MPNQTALATIQKYILLATGLPSSNALRDQLSQLHDQTGDLSQIAPLVDDFMTQQMLQNEKGVNGLLQAIYINGFSSELTDPETDQLVTGFLTQGIDSWSKLFAFLTTEIDVELGAILNNRAEAANLFTELLSERNLDTFHNVGIGASNGSLVSTNSAAQDPINRFSIAAVELSAIEQNDNNNGFVINDEIKEVTTEDDNDAPVFSSAGDVNGDGFADLIVGTSFSNASFVAFGKTDGTAIEFSDIKDGNSGFIIKGVRNFDYSGGSVSSAGDVNGDGLTDLIVGASGDDPNGYSSGASFVVFGKTDGTAVELSDVEEGDGGFVINGANADDLSGFSVSSAGDVNGDGFDDLIVGAPTKITFNFLQNGYLGGFDGASFVVFGKNNGAAVELSDVKEGDGGFVINEGSSFNRNGFSVSGAGDVNGDGLADLIVGAPTQITNDVQYNSYLGIFSGASFVVFGKTDGTAVKLSTIESGIGGFVIRGEDPLDFNDRSVSSAGDVNGDGLADLIVGAPGDDPNGNYSGASFVVFGKNDGSDVELSVVESGTGGFVINGVSTEDSSGWSVSSAGDVNGDGLDDLIVGAPFDDPNGISSGASFVVFGKSNGTAIELSDVESGKGGFVINGVGVNDTSGRSVSGAGDVNGDGFADLNIGAFSVNSNRRDGSYSGASFVVFGGQGTSATVGTADADMLIGDGMANQLVAGLSNDTLIGNGGADVLRGGAGNDTLAISDLTFAALDGGTGSDTLRFDAALNLDLRTLADTKLSSIEIIDLTNDGGNSIISLNLTDLLNINEAQTASDTLRIHGNAGDRVNLDNISNGQTGSWIDAGSGAYEFTAGDIGVIGTVTIDTGVTVSKIPNQAALANIQKYILLATGIPSSSALRDQISQIFDQTGDFRQVTPLIDDFMTQQVLQNEKGVSGVLQAIASNGFSSDLTDLEADKLVTDFLAQGINSWSKLFAFLTTDIDVELGATLDNRAEAANLFTDLLAERNLDTFHNNSQATNAAHEWLIGIDASNESLVSANSIAQDLINRFFIEAVELSAIEQNDNNLGFVVNGGRAAYGSSSSSVGDVNGDGLADLIVGASGASFVVFGKTDGTAVELSAVERGTGGFVTDGSGRSVSSAGDVNGDGLADLIVGAPGDKPNGNGSGASFVVFGKTDGTAVELSTIESGTGGFVINGVSNYDFSGSSVSSAGDVNGDGFADLIVGASRDDPNGTSSGASFVVFGKTDGTAVELSAVESGAGGFVINGVSAGDFSGDSVSSSGDVNGDGLADLVVDAPHDDLHGEDNGTVFVVFGKTDGTAVELSAVENGTGGFVISGVDRIDERSGRSVSSAGDVNGDGLADLIAGAPGDEPNGISSGASFVVFGKTDGTAVELSAVESGTGGFVINGVSAIDFSGDSVSSAGDVNGDGFADLIVGASGDDPNGNSSGASFVVFGKTDGTAVELSAVESGTDGFVINGVSTNDHSGDSVSSAGDVNGDGFADLIVGAFGDDPNGTLSGASFVVFGGQGTSATIGTTGADTLTGDNNANQLVAGMGDDTLVGNGGADILRGGAGNDILAVSDLTFASLDGGTGSDTLRFDVPLSLDLRILADTKLDSIEIVDLTNDGGNSTISLNLTDLLNLNEARTASDTLVIHGNTGDIVNLDNTSNGQTGSWANASSGVYEFTAGEIGIIGTVTIDTTVTVNII